MKFKSQFSNRDLTELKNSEGDLGSTADFLKQIGKKLEKLLGNSQSVERLGTTSKFGFYRFLSLRES